VGNLFILNSAIWVYLRTVFFVGYLKSIYMDVNLSGEENILEFFGLDRDKWAGKLGALRWTALMGSFTHHTYTFVASS